MQVGNQKAAQHGNQCKNENSAQIGIIEITPQVCKVPSVQCSHADHADQKIPVLPGKQPVKQEKYRRNQKVKPGLYRKTPGGREIAKIFPGEILKEQEAAQGRPLTGDEPQGQQSQIVKGNGLDQPVDVNAGPGSREVTVRIMLRPTKNPLRAKNIGIPLLLDSDRWRTIRNVRFRQGRWLPPGPYPDRGFWFCS